MSSEVSSRPESKSGLMTSRLWVPNYDEGVCHHFEPSNEPLTANLLKSARRFPRRAAIWTGRGDLSYLQLLSEVQKFAAVLAKLEVRSGDRVLLMLPNSIHFVVAFYGTLWRGAIAVVTTLDSGSSQLARQLSSSQPRVAVIRRPLPDGVENVLRENGPQQTILCSGREYLRSLGRWFTRTVGRALGARSRRKVLRWGSLMRGVTPRIQLEKVDPDHPAAILYTSGTTGPPRGVVLSHRALSANAAQLVAWDPQMGQLRERVLAAVPLSHSYGLSTALNLSVAVAGSLVVTPSAHPADVLNCCHRFRPTLFPGVPALYTALLARPDLKAYRLNSIRACISGAAPLPVELQEGFEKVTRGRLVEGYGLTEAAPCTHANPIYGRRRAGSIGLPLPGTDARIVSPTTLEQLEVGQVGELWVRGPQLMSGYWNDPEATAQVFYQGWLRTGDLALRDDEGYFFLINRLSDVVRLRQRTIYPRDIEEILYEHPAVLEGAVAGRPAEQPTSLGAYVVTRPGQSVSESELLAFCRRRLPEGMAPDSVVFLKSLPRTSFGKLKRHVLQES